MASASTSGSGAPRAAIILAAGASRRMGTPKALLTWQGTTLLGYAVQQARLAHVADVVVVLGPSTRAVHVEATTVVNPEPDTGRSASIRLGAAALSGSPNAILVQSVDQPAVAEILWRLFEAVEHGAEVAVPSHKRRRGHPVALCGELLDDLRQVREETQGLRAVVRAHAVTEVDVDVESVVWNLNDPAAYAAARTSE